MSRDLRRSLREVWMVEAVRTPIGRFGGALARVDSLVLLTNYRDPAMRFYHLSTEGRRTRALGWQGVSDRNRLGELAPRVQRFDVTETVGRPVERFETLGSHELLNRRPAPHQMERVTSNDEYPDEEHDHLYGVGDDVDVDPPEELIYQSHGTDQDDCGPKRDP